MSIWTVCYEDRQGENQCGAVEAEDYTDAEKKVADYGDCLCVLWCEEGEVDGEEF